MYSSQIKLKKTGAWNVAFVVVYCKVLIPCIQGPGLSLKIEVEGRNKNGGGGLGV